MPPEETSQSKRDRLKEELTYGVNATKAALQAQFGKLTFYNDYVYEEGDIANVTYFKLNGKEWALFGSACEFQVDNYAIVNFADDAPAEERSGVWVNAEQYGKPLARQFVNKFYSK